jgi:transposase
MAVTDGNGLPIAIGIFSASPHESQLVEETLSETFADFDLERLIGDKAYDSDDLDDRLYCERGIELIAPNRENKKNQKQDGRQLRRYKRRWKVERFFSWLHSFRRVVTRFEHDPENFLGMVQLACIKILIRQF